jgi:hypothetical protein
MSQGRATPERLCADTSWRFPRENRFAPCTTLWVQHVMVPQWLTISSEPSTSSLWNAGGNRGRMEALMGHVLHTCRRFLPEGRMTCIQEGDKNSKAGVGNGRADGPFPSRKDGAACS